MVSVMLKRDQSAGLYIFLQLQSTVWVLAPSWINEGVVLPGGCNLTRDEQEVEAVCKEVIIIMVHGI